MIAQIIFLSLVFIGLLLAAYKHGKERSNYNFWEILIGCIINLLLLWWGGFFNVFFK